MTKNLVQIALIASLISACSSKPKDVSNTSRGEANAEPQASIESKQVAAEQEAQFVTEIEFKKGSTELTSTARRKIERLLNSVQDSRTIDEVKVISWADAPYPSQETKNLPRDQVSIAQDRNQEILSFIKTQNKNVPVEVHNMAQRPSAVGKLFGADDARIKRSLENSGLTSVGNEAKASQAIVMIITE